MKIEYLKNMKAYLIKDEEVKLSAGIDLVEVIKDAIKRQNEIKQSRKLGITR